MSAIGMCPHNNLASYCVACVQDTRQQLGKVRSMRGGMGYDLFGVNVPSLSEIAQAAAGGAGSAITASAASSPGVQAAAKTATGNVIGNWILAHWKTVALGVVVVSAGVYILGKKSKRI